MPTTRTAPSYIRSPSLTMRPHPAQLSHPAYRPDIDGLRAIAVLSVVAYHAFPTALPGGFIGVDVFFVISGFLISTIIFQNLDQASFSFAEFYARRIKRIFPALLLVLIFSYALGWFALLSSEYQQLGKHIASSATFTSNFILWDESSYFDNAAETKPLLHLWSLAVEEQFYLFYPLLLGIAWKLKLTGKRHIKLFILTFIVALISFILNKKGVKKDMVAAFYSPQTRFWELLCGSLLAWFTLYKKSQSQPSADLQHSYAQATISISRDPLNLTPPAAQSYVVNALSLLGIALLTFGFVRINSGLRFPGKWALIPVLGATLLIAAGPNAWLNRHILAQRFLVWFGLISFPLYLWHWPLLSFAHIMESEVPSSSIRLAAVVLATCLAWLTYRFIERHIRSYNWHKTKVFTLLTSMLLVGWLGHYTYQKDGLPWRPAIKVIEARKNPFYFDKHAGHRPETAKIMLLGDSHAGHLAPGLQKILGQNFADFSSNGCIPLYDLDRYENRMRPGTCLKHMTQALAYFEKNSHMRSIILSSMGPVYLSNKAFKGLDIEREQGNAVTLSTQPQLTDQWAMYAFAMRNTLQRLTSANKKILFVIDIPELAFDPHRCIRTRPLALTLKKYQETCAFTREEYDQRIKQYKTMVYGILQDFPSVLVYDPTNDFCDQTQCWAAKNGKMLYRDVDHLSNEGSYFMTQKMRPLIEQLL